MAIRSVNDPGGFGRLAQTVLRNRAIDQERQAREGQLRTDRDLAKGFAANTGNVGLPFAPLPQQDANLVAETPGGTLADLARIQSLRPKQTGPAKFGPLTEGVDAAGDPVFFSPDPTGKARIVQDVSPIIKSSKTGGPDNAQPRVDKLRTSVEKATKSFGLVNEAFGRIKAVGSNATPASDLALIFNFMKMLDPGSVVRESEFRTAENAKAWLVKKEEDDFAVPAPIANAIRKISEGTLLETPQRTDFLNQASDLFGAQRESTDSQINNILQLADQDEIAREKVLGSERFESFQARERELANRARFEEEKAKRTGQPTAQPTPVLPQGVSAADFATLLKENIDLTADQLLEILSPSEPGV